MYEINYNNRTSYESYYFYYRIGVILVFHTHVAISWKRCKIET